MLRMDTANRGIEPKPCSIYAFSCVPYLLREPISPTNNPTF